MKNISLLLLLLLAATHLYSQSDDCATATVLAVGSACMATAGTTVGASQSEAPTLCATFTSTAAEDVWYQFVATASTQLVLVDGDPGFDPVVHVYSTCGGSSIGCSDGTTGGGVELVTLTGLTVGSTYYVRVYGYSITAGAGEGSFTICVSMPPANDDCAGAVQLTGTMNSVSGNTFLATQTIAGCTGNADDDVWYYFIPTTSTNVTITVTPGGTNLIGNAVFQIMSGSCPNGTTVICRNATTGMNPETYTFAAVASTTYYIRVYSNGATVGNRGEFTIALTPASALPLELKTFTGKVAGNMNILYWETLTEKNVQFHVVERSADGLIWSEIGRKTSRGDSQASVQYELEDHIPLLKAYYRLRSVDFNGQESFSNSILLTRKGEHFGISRIFPSPAKEEVTVQFISMAAETVTIHITDLTGRIVRTQYMEAIKDMNEMPVTLNGLPAGIYTVTTANSTGTSTPVRFIIQ